jgi:murein DD-endopeptidase MepM/ murein hydrolase activator NlpD
MAGQGTALGLRIHLLVLYGLLVLTATVVGALAIGGLRGEVPMKLAGLLVALGWLGFSALGMIILARGWPTLAAGPSTVLRWTRWWLLGLVWFAPVAGLPLAFLAFVNCGPAWIPPLFHWSGLALTAVGLSALYSLPAFARLYTGAVQDAAPSRRWWVIVVHCSAVAVAWALAWGIPYFALLRDDVDEADYAGAPSGFLLPWPGGEDGWVIQGNDAGMNHNSAHSQQKFAWDFRRECGTPVLAAKAGTVTGVEDGNDGIGGDNNAIKVQVDGGLVASYLHIQKDSAVVKKGAVVAQGAMLARVGCVGNSLTGHIHFHVRQGADTTTTVAVRFDDVDSGVPRTFGSYTSGNR